MPLDKASQYIATKCSSSGGEKEREGVNDQCDARSSFWLFVIAKKKTSIFHFSVVDHEFRHNIGWILQCYDEILDQYQDRYMKD